ncbi:MAG TPA: T9SS type A sorting domain-containing protein [Bacteroidales bacterium]|nr:T9SS type A sorting domain-containing protein [Bacteroidales bacterium]
MNPPNYGQTYAYKIKDSILLNDQKYWFKVFESSDSSYSEWKLNGYIREENKIVLYSNQLWGIDTLYNFNKTVGDTIEFNHCNIKVSGISSEIIAGKNRKSYDIINTHNTFDVKYYEGIGSNEGILAPYYFCATGACRSLVCFYKNNELLYLNPAFTTCYLHSQLNNIVSTKEISFCIYPNPSTGIISISLNNNSSSSNFDFVIYNSLGTIVAKQSINTAKTLINLSYLAKGVYYYRLNYQKNTYKIGILLITL